MQARHGVQQGQRRQLAAGDHKVTQAQLDVDVAVDETLVDALVAPSQEHRTGAWGVFGHERLVDAAPGGREMDHGRTVSAGRADRL